MLIAWCHPERGRALFARPSRRACPERSRRDPYLRKNIHRVGTDARRPVEARASVGQGFNPDSGRSPEAGVYTIDKFMGFSPLPYKIPTGAKARGKFGTHKPTVKTVGFHRPGPRDASCERGTANAVPLLYLDPGYWCSVLNSEQQ